MSNARTLGLATMLAPLTFALSASAATQLTTAGGQVPAWSPSGSFVVFADDGDLWVVSAGGGAPMAVTTNPGLEWDPEWSPDGTEIAFTSSAAGTDDIYVIGVPGGSATRVIHTPGFDRSPTFSPDGTQIAYSTDRGGDRDIWIYDRVVDTHTQLTFDADEEMDLDWSPDGQWIAYRRGVAGSNIAIVDVSGGLPIELTGGTEAEATPSWTPDSQSLLFASFYTGSWDLYSVPVTGGMPTVVLNDFATSESMPAWSPLGDRYAYVSDESGTFEVWLSDLILGVDSSSAAPAVTRAALGSAPNPFRVTTRLGAALDGETEGGARFTVYDARGRRVRMLSAERTAVGFEADWDGRNTAGVELPNGVYYYRLETAGGASTAARAILAR